MHLRRSLQQLLLHRCNVCPETNDPPSLGNLAALPPEIRCEIYRQVFDDEYRWPWLWLPTERGSHCPKPMMDKRTCPTVLIASKSISEEAIQVFYKELTFLIEGGSIPIKYESDSTAFPRKIGMGMPSKITIFIELMHFAVAFNKLDKSFIPLPTYYGYTPSIPQHIHQKQATRILVYRSIW